MKFIKIFYKIMISRSHVRRHVSSHMFCLLFDPPKEGKFFKNSKGTHLIPIAQIHYKNLKFHNILLNSATALQNN